MKKTGFFGALIRGGLKTIPGIGPIVELIKNVKAERFNKDNPGAEKDLPHNYWSITIQVLGIAAIIYAFVTHAITIDDLLRLIHFGTPAPAPTV